MANTKNAADEIRPKDGHRQDSVSVTINDVAKEIHRGRQTVADIKKAGDVALADDLEELVGGKLTGLPDEGSVTIKGGEVFVSHPKDSSSSDWPPALTGAR